MEKLLEIGIFLDLLNKKLEKAKLVTTNPNDSIRTTIDKMLKNEYSQLPVKKRGKLVGVFSFESLAKSVFCLTKTMSKTSFKVKDCMEKTTKTYGNKDDLLSLLDTLGTKSYILIGEGKKVTNIITSYDALRFFSENSRIRV